MKKYLILVMLLLSVASGMVLAEKTTNETLVQKEIDAKAALDTSTALTEQSLVRAADDAFILGVVSELQMKDKEALTYYARSISLQPKNQKYLLAFKHLQKKLEQK